MKKIIFLGVLFLLAFSLNTINAQERVVEDTIAGFRFDKPKTPGNSGEIIISVRETESGSVKGGDPPYPYTYTESMRFEGKIINNRNKIRLIPNLTDNLRTLALKEECTLIAELEPVEESMKVEKWECSDPVNNSPILPLLAASPPNFFIPVRIWQIGRKIYISHGFNDGIYGYFVEWNETESRNGRRWNPDGSEPISYFNHQTDDLSTTFTPGPVEDPVPDPTITGVAESLRTYLKNLGTPLPANIEIPEDEERAEVAPDLLVQYGDGKTFFGGRGKKITDNSEGSNINRKEMTFNWSVTRRKKPL